MRLSVIAIGLIAAAVPVWCAKDAPVARAYQGDDNLVHIVTVDGRDRAIQAEKGQAGIENVRVAGDSRTVGWLVDVPSSCCMSYPIPVELVLWRSGRVIRKFWKTQAIFGWAFLRGGEEVAYHTAPLHGSEIYQCYREDVGTERLLDQWSLASKTPPPDWVKPLDAQVPIPDHDNPDNGGTPAPQ
ncbi:MAG TPA: hypothetical protein VKB38_11790 [Terracidiphilus sp.]|nr:hypothetical protein [Terracidiphilus sp.]